MQRSENFELVFGLAVRIGVRKLRQGGKLRRVISVQTLEIAKKVALAMLGEEIYRGQYLDEILSVGLAGSAAPHISTFNHEYTWERVLQAFQLPDGAYFLYDAKERKIGLYFNDSELEQIARLKL